MLTKIGELRVEVPAKWVLSGEHSVLRGGHAVTMPLPEFSLRLSFRRGKTALPVMAPESLEMIRGLASRAAAYLGVAQVPFEEGAFELESSIPIGAGLGSSAALCVAVARMVIALSGSDDRKTIALATHLEDGFHGKSSGMDVQAVSLGLPMHFSMKEGGRPLPDLKDLPRFEFHDSGIRARTRDCIERVREWGDRFPEQVGAMDRQMREAGALAVQGLGIFQTDRKEGLALIQRSMELSGDCFETWGLLTPELVEQKTSLLNQGALAVRLTGAGLGGFFVSLRAGAREGG